MAYEVTATRRRPGRFEDMIGQDFVVATLQKSIQAGRIAPAYLFSGPRGCGKTSSARILARALNCEKGPASTPCGECNACKEIARGSSLDVIEIDGASNTSVNDVRQIKDEVQFPPNSCRYKIYIIDEVHMLSTSAFNALLKTIEEPPPYVIFIFATTELHKVPATIKSRCQQFNFRLVPVETLKAALSDAAAETGVSAEDEALYWIAREATGSVRDAYTLFDQVAAFSDGSITFDKIRDKLGLVGVDRLNGVIDACAQRDASAALSGLDAILDSGVSVEQFTVDLCEYLRNLLLIKSGITRESLLGQSSDRFSAQALEAWSAPQIERALSLVLQLYKDLRYSLEPRYELELFVSRLSWIGDYVSASDMRAALERAQSLLAKGASASAGPASAKVGGSLAGGQATGASPIAAISNGEGRAASGGMSSGGSMPAGGTRANGPFPDAGRDASPVGLTAIRESVDEDSLTDPFAALKRRFSGVAPGNAANQAESSVQAQPEPPRQSEPPPQPTPPRQPRRDDLSAQDDIPARDIVRAEGTAPLAQRNLERQTEAASLSSAELKDALVSFFKQTKNMLATGLMQASGWTLEGDVVRVVTSTPFSHSILATDRALLSSAASKCLGRPVSVEIDLVEEESQDDGAQAIPRAVEMVRDMFKGTIVTGA